MLLMNKLSLLLTREQQLEAILEKNLRSGLGEKKRYTIRLMVHPSSAVRISMPR